MQHLLHKTSSYRDSSGSRPLNEGTLEAKHTSQYVSVISDYRNNKCFRCGKSQIYLLLLLLLLFRA